MADIHIGIITDAMVSQRSLNGILCRDVKLTIPSDVQTTNKGNQAVQTIEYWLARQKLLGSEPVSVANMENPLATPSAGGISFYLDDNGEPTYVSFCQKDAGAPRDPGFRVPRNGFPRSESDWYSLNHLVEETFEEGIFLTRDHELLLPRTGTKEMRAVIEKTAENLVRQTGLSISGTYDADIYFMDGPDTLSISGPVPDHTQRTFHSGYFSWTPETGTNFIKPLMVAYPYEDLLLVDGETFPDGKVICRDVCAMHLDLLAGKRFGDRIVEDVFRHDKKGNITVDDRFDKFYCDKVPRSVLSRFSYKGEPIYPQDWAAESAEFFEKILADPRKDELLAPVYAGKKSLSSIERMFAEQK